jgi:hypothetical protein
MAAICLEVPAPQSLTSWPGWLQAMAAVCQMHQRIATRAMAVLDSPIWTQSWVKAQKNNSECWMILLMQRWMQLQVQSLQLLQVQKVMMAMVMGWKMMLLQYTMRPLVGQQAAAMVWLMRVAQMPAVVMEEARSPQQPS